MSEFLERILIGAAHRTTIAKYAEGPDKAMGILTIVAAALLGMFLTSPFMTVANFYGLQGTFTPINALVALFKGGQGTYALAGAVLFVILPLINISTAFEIWYKHQLHEDKFEKFTRRMQFCGRFWFLSAVSAVGLAYLVNTSPDGALHIPIYYLFLSLIMQKLCLTRMSRLAGAVKFVEKEED